MKRLVARFAKAVKGVLTGFVRIVFKGTILPLAHEDGAMSFLGWRGVLNRDDKNWMQAQTDAWVTAVGQYAREQTGRPITAPRWAIPNCGAIRLSASICTCTSITSSTGSSLGRSQPRQGLQPAERAADRNHDQHA